MYKRPPRQASSDPASLPTSADTASTRATDPPTSQTDSSSIPTSSRTSSPPTSRPQDNTSSSLPPSTDPSPSPSATPSSSNDPSSLSPTSTQDSQTSTLTPTPTQSQLRDQTQSESSTQAIFRPTSQVGPTSISSTEGLPTSFTTIVTSLDGQLVTTVSPLPTSLAADRSIHDSNSSSAGIIAGATIGGVVILVLIGLALVFAYRRNKLRKFLEELTNKKREREGLLADEIFDDDDEHRPRHHRQGTSSIGSSSVMQMHRQSPSATIPLSPLVSTHPYPSYAANAQLNTSSAPSLFPARARASESGSLFHEDGVWPPPGNGTGPFVDPFAGHIKLRSDEIDLGKAVDDVMGRWSSNAPSRRQTDGSTSVETPSLYSTSNTANEHDVGFNSVGSTPSPPTQRSPTSSTNRSPALPPGAAPSMIPGVKNFGTSTSSAPQHNPNRRGSSPLSNMLDDGAFIR